MIAVVVVLLFVVIGLGLLVLFRWNLAAAVAQDRLADNIRLLDVASVLSSASRSTDAEVSRPFSLMPLRRRWWWVPYLVGLICSILVVWLTSIPPVIGWASGLVVALLLAQLESVLYQRIASKIEQQMIDLLDMMIPMLRSGAGAMTALSAASEQIKSPMQDQIQWCVRRIQLGDRGNEVFQALADHVPSDVVELFSTTMSVHWETGGSLAPILASVSRVARDRQEVARRIRSNIAQSQFSTIAVLLLIYFVALILWLDRPEQVEEFVTSDLGSIAVAVTVVLQSVGILWMNAMSKPKS